MAELTLEERRFNLVQTDHITFFMKDWLTRLRCELMTLPNYIAGTYSGTNSSDLAALIDKHVRGVLNSAARQAVYFQNDTEAPPPKPIAAMRDEITAADLAAPLRSAVGLVPTPIKEPDIL